jgi:hypothetical protein
MTILFSVLLLAGCVQPNSVPDDVIPEEKMILVLTDIHLLEGAYMSTQFIEPGQCKKGHHIRLQHHFQKIQHHGEGV